MDTFEIADTGSLGYVHQLVIFCVQLLESGFDRQLPIWSSLQFLQLNMSTLYLFRKFGLRWKQEEQGTSFGFVPCCPPYSMNICADVFRTVKLNNPINSRKINTPSSNICRKQHSWLLLHELKVYCCPFTLLHLSMELKQVLPKLESFECLIGKSYLFSGREKYQTLRLWMAFEKTEKSV